MSETVVRVDLRQASLSETARLRAHDGPGDLLFLAIDNPPPVRSLLSLRDGDQRKAFEVVRVVEVVDEDESARGCYGREIPVERLDEQAKVGSEHLEPGITSGGGVPAPVVIMNTSEMMLGEAGEDAERYAHDSDSSDEHSDDEHSNDEHSNDEHSDDEHSDDERSDDERSDDERSDDDQRTDP
jgi:hypothetical protein